MRNPAAVLIGIINDQLVLTKRAAGLRSYTGHICLPGGQADATDDGVVATALREFNEEVYYRGTITPLFCMLPEYSAIRHQAVYPVVAHLDGAILGFNSDEVAKLILLPLRDLHPDCFSLNLDYPQIKHNLCFNYADEAIWGLTAFILHKFTNHYQNHFRK